MDTTANTRPGIGTENSKRDKQQNEIVGMGNTEDDKKDEDGFKQNAGGVKGRKEEARKEKEKVKGKNNQNY